MLVVAIEESLDLRAWQVIGEFLVNLEPGRIDAVVIRRTDPHTIVPDDWRPEYLRSVLDDLRPYNVGVAQPARAPLVPAHARVPRPPHAPRSLR